MGRYPEGSNVGWDTPVDFRITFRLQCSNDCKKVSGVGVDSLELQIKGGGFKKQEEFTGPADTPFVDLPPAGYYDVEVGSDTDDGGDLELSMEFDIHSYNYGSAKFKCVTEGGDPPIWGNIQAFSTPEYAVGQDLNGDGDTSDTVLRYRNLETGEVINTGLLVSPLYREIDIYENIIAFATEGSSVIRYYDITTGSVGNIGIPGRAPSVHKNIIAFVSEGTIHYYDLSTRTLKDTGLRGFFPSVYGDWIAFSLRSSGPFYTIGLYNLRSGTVTNTGVVGQNPSLYGDKIAFETWEYDVQEDLNGDGDMNDRVIRYYDVTTQTVTNTGAVGQFPALYGSRIAFTTAESDVGQDLNSDGKILGNVIRYYDLSTGQVVNTGELGTEPDIYEDTISFYLWESWADADLNGDGDQSDPIVSTYRIALTEAETAARGSGTVPVGTEAGAAGGLSLALLALAGVALGRRLLS
jgi:hypothetical protein